ncbi:MAG: cell wall-active antibiotics response protein [Bacteroidales bacterium]|nr:cell wall-active antibiotics response protein [Bacteroidales bacterium]MCF8388273.1 cell wall-active antibiotics response protein [Bacteroidales bacterium]MCF8399129.1 cell wall-active antibiotics response protein [Bacteroidales bacterium]
MKKFVFGFIVMAAGALLLLFNFDILNDDYKHIFFSWQMLLIALGVINIFSWKDRFVGWILIAVGVFFLAPDVLHFDFNFVKLFWPALLIFIGIMIIYSGRKIRRWKHREKDSNLDSGYIDETNIFGGSKQRFTNQIFKGGKIANIFGGSEIDLSQVELQEGKSELEINCIFGGVGLVVPSDWKVTTRVSNILGGFSDKRQIITASKDSSKELIITGTMIFGGGEIKSY